MSSDDLHPIDKWEKEAEEENAKVHKQAVLDTSLIFETFSTPAGKMLIDKWSDALMDVPSATPGLHVNSVMMNEGEKRFVRMIRNSIKLHESKL